jgi:hypothetical protein
MSTDVLIAALVAVAVFICLGRALPNPSRLQTTDDSAASGRRPASTRLSRASALAISLGLETLFVMLLRFAPMLGGAVASAIVAISVWTAVDSHKVRLAEYRTRIALSPIALFNVMIFLWPLVFPWYLIVCSKIGDGSLARKSNNAHDSDRI